MIKIQGLSKSFKEYKILQDVSFTIKPGEILGLVGVSGSGKTTLLKCIQGLDEFDNGKIVGAEEVGMIFQNYHLFPHMNVIENIVYAPIHVEKQPVKKVYAQAEKLLKRIGIFDKRNNLPKTLSGGQKQRVAIARALMMQPKTLLLDEPTSALDPISTAEVVSMLKELEKQGLAIVIASHDLAFLERVVGRAIFLHKGKVLFDEPKGKFFTIGNNKVKKEFFAALSG
jgi:polar amino acid transport system ATP-binding protein